MDTDDRIALTVLPVLAIFFITGAFLYHPLLLTLAIFIILGGLFHDKYARGRYNVGIECSIIDPCEKYTITRTLEESVMIFAKCLRTVSRDANPEYNSVKQECLEQKWKVIAFYISNKSILVKLPIPHEYLRIYIRGTIIHYTWERGI